MLSTTTTEGIKMRDQNQKADKGKSDPMLLEEDFVHQLAAVNAVLDFGVAKYGKRGGWKAVEPSRYKSALARHNRRIMMGEVFDKESGLPHWAHCIANQLFLAWFSMDGEGVDVESYAMFTPPKPVGDVDAND